MSLMPADSDGRLSERMTMVSWCPAWLITPMLLITHVP
jgi:hypothetical protein